MKSIFGIAALLLILAAAGSAQSSPAEPPLDGDIAGLYSFLHEGEFVQIEVEQGRVGGLVSHFKDEDLNKAEFVDQRFEHAKLDGSTLSFRTQPAGGVWFEFSGTVKQDPAKAPGDDAYWTVSGTLTERHTAQGNAAEKMRRIKLRSFPEKPLPNAMAGDESQGSGNSSR